MNKLLATMMAALGLSQSPASAADVQMIDPSTILFSTPTIANDLPPLEPATRAPGDLVLHEDEWTQNEFLPKAMLPELRRMLSEFKTFEAKHRTGSGWREIYVRKIKRESLIAGANALVHLQAVLGAKAKGELLLDGTEGAARVKNGFVLEIGRSVHLYGHANADGIRVIGADLGPNPDDEKLVEAFKKLNASDGLVLVDWRQRMLLVSVAPDGDIDVWRP
jgi:hypothetical protein